MTARVVLYGLPGCHLCDEARSVVARVCAELDERFEEVWIDSDAALIDRYSEQIPVTVVDGVELSIWRVDEARLRAALTG